MIVEKFDKKNINVSHKEPTRAVIEKMQMQTRGQLVIFIGKVVLDIKNKRKWITFMLLLLRYHFDQPWQVQISSISSRNPQSHSLDAGLSVSPSWALASLV